MIRYGKWKKQRQESFSKLPFKAAFGKEQFAEMMKSWGLNTNKEDMGKIRQIGPGCYCLAKDAHLFREWQDEQNKLDKEYLSNEEQLKDALMYEWGNYECGLTMNPDEGIRALFDKNEIQTNELLHKVFPTAWKEFLAHYD